MKSSRYQQINEYLPLFSRQYIQRFYFFCNTHSKTVYKLKLVSHEDIFKKQELACQCTSTLSNYSCMFTRYFLQLTHSGPIS